MFINNRKSRSWYMKFILLLLFVCFNLTPQANELYIIIDDLKTNYNYEYDHILFGCADYWQTVEEFETLKKGDCEDFALYIRDKLNKKQYAVTTYVIHCIAIGHAFNIVWDFINHKVYITDNNYLIHIPKGINNNLDIIEWYANAYNFNLKAIYKVSDNCLYGIGSEEMYTFNYTLIKHYDNQ